MSAVPVLLAVLIVRVSLVSDTMAFMVPVQAVATGT